MIRTRSNSKVGRSRRDRRNDSLHGSPCVRGFTLVELLLVISIIGILATVSISVTRQVYHTARVAKTDSTIMKIDRVIMDMYAGYENRRVPSHNFGSNDVASKVTQAARLWFLRDMIRMEMPGNWDEVNADPVSFSFKYLNIQGNPQTTVPIPSQDSPLRRLYKNTYDDALARSDVDTVNRYAPAKCLYLIIMYGNPEARELFFDHEIATDDDGLSYFVDGWGNPIYYLRWAPGLSLSERQPNVLGPQQNEVDWGGADKITAAESRPDPLDPTEVGGTVSSTKDQLKSGQWVIDLTGTPRHGWALLPVIMSSGGELADTFGDSFAMKMTTQVLDIDSNGNDETVIPTVDPFCSAVGAFKSGQVNHAIIHNHRTRR